MIELPLETTADGIRIGIAAAEFNGFITRELLAGAIEGLERHGVTDDALVVAWVPGAFELPLAAQQLLTEGQCDAVIALGAVIRGQTAHFDYVSGECSRGLMQVSLEQARPVIFGVLTTDTIEQAHERAARDAGNKGFDCAVAALQMVSLATHLAGGD
ncbi:MAG: 6,7-dimethyl-8-ribityllumazine synthase [Xanthomonadales bacterium]|nr:6,7-dimethyl-8-ribityllumazine synthase [Xanthomonadales bacterium]